MLRCYYMLMLRICTICIRYILCTTYDGPRHLDGQTDPGIGRRDCCLLKKLCRLLISPHALSSALQVASLQLGNGNGIHRALGCPHLATLAVAVNTVVPVFFQAGAIADESCTFAPRTLEALVRVRPQETQWDIMAKQSRVCLPGPAKS